MCLTKQPITRYLPQPTTGAKDMLLIDLFPTICQFAVFPGTTDSDIPHQPHNNHNIESTVKHIPSSPQSPIVIHTTRIQFIPHPDQPISETTQLHHLLLHTSPHEPGVTTTTCPKIFTLTHHIQEGDEEQILIRKGNLILLFGIQWELVMIEFGETRAYLYYAPTSRHPLTILNIKLENCQEPHITGFYKPLRN